MTLTAVGVVEIILDGPYHKMPSMGQIEETAVWGEWRRLPSGFWFTFDGEHRVGIYAPGSNFPDFDRAFGVLLPLGYDPGDEISQDTGGRP